jgi:hypothetical protein
MDTTLPIPIRSVPQTTPRLQALVTANLGLRLGQCRVAPVRRKARNAPAALVAAYGADFDIDPSADMFFFPTGTLNLAMISLDDGQVTWTRDLGRSVVPGMWFCPVLPFDLDGDGDDEIFFVNNADHDHPLSLSHYQLEQLDPRTGQTVRHMPWPVDDRYALKLSHAYRYFLVGGHVRGEPVLVMANGTYGAMHLRAFNRGLSLRWELHIPPGSPGARGSHMCPVLDINSDGVDELMWGERCLSLDDGGELFCCDRDSYDGHSDVIQPVRDAATGDWSIFTCRENGTAAPRVACYDAEGRRLWGAVEQGHMDMGWVARLGDDAGPVATAIRIGHKTAGPAGRAHLEREEFAFDARTGEPVDLGFDTYGSLPVDLNGDGLHELVNKQDDGAEILNRDGRPIGRIDGTVAAVGKLLACAGEQVVTFAPDGKLRVWADVTAADSPAALQRYRHPAYAANQRLTASGYNLTNLAGI